jgi:hypothetical protein
MHYELRIMNYFVSLQEILREVSYLSQFMRHYLILFATLILMTASCGGRKSGDAQDTVPDDSTIVADSVSADSLNINISDIPMPRAADELFDDFVFNFAANRKLQMERVAFPLLVVRDNKQERMTKAQWQMEYFFMRQGFYTLLFDSEKHMEVVKDTSVHHAVVEKIFFESGSITQYVFNRLRGTWMLTQMKTIPIQQSTNSSFLDFYHHFATSPDFQAQHLGETVKFVGPDPDDDFSMMEGVITPDTWEAFAPELPGDMIYNIIYGESRKESNTKVFVVRGIANGFELEMTFQRTHGQWKLTKLTT